ncbi:MAG: TetR family transcriptional regulator [Proteobacteria bacterium]|nr:MAG: TetR family transcriptional regulator [Pseudomonadota bacterium]
MGLREEKKAKTRKAISDLATSLFIERGYDNVTTAEIARQAEVSVPTLFKYFPTKESLVFDEDHEQEEKLLNAVTKRRSSVSILDALCEELLDASALNPDNVENYRVFNRLIDSTPELSAYSKKMWMRYEESLAKLLQKQSKKSLGTFEAEAIAHFILDSAHRSMRAPDPRKALHAMFKVLKEGWDE